MARFNSPSKRWVSLPRNLPAGAWGSASAGAWSEQATDQIVRLNHDAVIAEWTLNEDGDGVCEIPDALETRQALLHPVIGLIEDDE